MAALADLEVRHHAHVLVFEIVAVDESRIERESNAITADRLAILTGYVEVR